MRYSRRSIQRKTLAVLAVADVFSGAGFATVMTAGSLLVEHRLGVRSAAGLPVGLFMLGTAVAAFWIGWISQRHGRRVALVMGFACGASGGLAVVGAATLNLTWLLFAALFVYGAGFATDLQARYACTDLARPEHRGFAISISMMATTVGAVVAPNLLAPMALVARTIGLPPLSGLFLLGGSAYGVACLVTLAGLVPDPYLLATRAKLNTRQRRATAPAVPLAPAATLYAAAAILILGQIAMMATIAMTPIHMDEHMQALGAIGLVIGTHVGAMYFPSPLTGVLVDRVGRTPMVLVAALLMAVACVTAALGPVQSLLVVLLAMIALGLGWNCSLIAGSAMVVDATRPEQRPRVQGTIDLLLALGAGLGSIAAGFAVATAGYAVLVLGCAALALLLVPLALWARASSRRSVDAYSACDKVTNVDS